MGLLSQGAQLTSLSPETASVVVPLICIPCSFRVQKVHSLHTPLVTVLCGSCRPNTPTAAAAACMSISFCWVWLPRPASILTWSSTWGMSAFAAVRTRGVATCQHQLIKCEVAPSSLSTAYKMVRLTCRPMTGKAYLTSFCWLGTQRYYRPGGGAGSGTHHKSLRDCKTDVRGARAIQVHGTHKEAEGRLLARQQGL